MNEKMKVIASKLKKLLICSKPYSFDKGYINGGCCNDCDHLLYARLKPIFEAARDDVDQMEIVNAALENREADLIRPEVNPYNWRQEIPWAASKKLWDYCSDAIKREVALFNSERLMAYELYRQECISGKVFKVENQQA